MVVKWKGVNSFNVTRRKWASTAPTIPGPFINYVIPIFPSQVYLKNTSTKMTDLESCGKIIKSKYRGQCFQKHNIIYEWPILPYSGFWLMKWPKLFRKLFSLFSNVKRMARYRQRFSYICTTSDLQCTSPSKVGCRCKQWIADPDLIESGSDSA